MTFTVKRRFFKAPGNDHWFFSFGNTLQSSENPTIDPRDTLYSQPDEKRLKMQSIWLSGPYRIWNNPRDGISLKWEREYLNDQVLLIKYYFDTEQEARDFYNWYEINMSFKVPVGAKDAEFEIVDPDGAIILQNY
jgi:hypothetical protein